MNIVFLTRRFYPDIGGVEKHVSEVSKELTEAGHRVTVVTESVGKPNMIGKVNIVRLPSIPDNWFRKFYIWNWMIKNKKMFDSVDVVHAHDVYFWYFPLKILNPFKKSFVTFHGYETKFPPSKKAILIRKISEELANGNICVGNYIRKWYGARSDYIVEGGVSLPKATKLPVVNDKSALFIGRTSKDTGIDSYRKAYSKLKEVYPDFMFDYVKKSLDPNSQISKHRFVFASGYLSMLEGLSNRKIVFAVYENPLKKDYLLDSTIGQHVIVCQDENDIASQVTYFLKNPDKEKEMVEKSYKWAKAQTWDKISDMYIKLWNKK